MSLAPAPLPRLSALMEAGIAATRPAQRSVTGHRSRLIDPDLRHGPVCACPLLAAALAAGADFDDLCEEREPDEQIDATLQFVAKHVGYDLTRVRVPWTALPPPLVGRLPPSLTAHPAISLQALIIILYDSGLLGRNRIAALVKELGY